MEKDSKVYLEHILKAAIEIADFINGFTEEDFLRDQKTQLAIIKNIEIMGEATKKNFISYKNHKPKYSIDRNGSHAR